ncbi:hypothetical protein KY321_03865 [Candidatus Woesearchaeota archaeon]|nr:hypothetical protein [Candidatus Woesearchaeota archaeon]
MNSEAVIKSPEIICKNTFLGEGKFELETLTEKEYIKVVNTAYALKKLDEDVDSRELVQRLKRELNPNVNIDIETVYEAAEELGISGNYVTRALALKQISIEQQILDLKETNAITSHEVMVDDFNDMLLKCLQLSRPLEKFEYRFGSYKYHFNRIDKDEMVKEKGFLWFTNDRRVLEKTRLASVKYDRLGYVGKEKDFLEMEITFHDPVFPNICNDILKRLKEFYAHQIKSFQVVRNYQIK